MKVRIGYTVEHNGRLYNGGDTIPPQFLEEVKKKASWRLENEKEKLNPNRKTSEEKREEIKEKEIIPDDVVNRAFTNKNKVKDK